MKNRKFRIIPILVAALMLLSFLPTKSYAAANSATADRTVYFEDGSYMVITTEEIDPRMEYTKIARRLATRYNADDELQWRITLTANFYYDSIVCILNSAYTEFEIFNDKWYVISEDTACNGLTASTNVMMGYKTFGITALRVPANITITCDKDGNLS